MKGFVLAQEGVVESGWIDSNGHMNIRWYAAIFDEGTAFILDQLSLERIGTAADRPTIMASRVYVEHRKEMFEGESWQLWSGLASISRGGATISHRLRCGRAVRATCDIRGVVVARSTRTRRDLPERIIKDAQRLLIPGIADRFALAR